MPTVNYNAQSFAIDARRFWIVGASLSYARIPVEDWQRRIEDVRQAGFNTVLTECPWFLHEPRKGRYSFDGPADVGQFIQLCGAAGLRVVLKLGPFVGAGLSGGGLPGWLNELPEIALREANAVFLEHAGRYLRKLIGAVADQQATAGGPIILVQSEHAWTCANPEQVEKYLNEITRIIRENGINVPVINANDLWTESTSTVDTWRGRSNMLPNVRQLRTVQPVAPRVVSHFDPATTVAFGDKFTGGDPPHDVVRDLAEVLAGGGQPIVTPFHGGTNFGFVSGKLPGRPGAMATTAAALDAPLGEAGARTITYRAMRRLIHFANSFSGVFSDLDPEFQPVTLDLDSGHRGSGQAGDRRPPLSVVPQRGGQGQVVFAFADRRSRQGLLLLESGMRMPVHLGDQTVGWYVVDVDCHGQGRLDYANLCPFALVPPRTVVLQGPERFPVHLSVGGSALDRQVPGGKKPLIVKHQGLVFVICNQTQIDFTDHRDGSVYVGADGFEADGTPRPAPGFGEVLVIDAEGETTRLRTGAANLSRRAPRRGASLTEWQAASSEAQVAGKSPRYATLGGPQTLAACGAVDGYGWYRVQFRTSRTGKRRCHLPMASDRVHCFVDGEFKQLFGVGPGADSGAFEIHLTKGSHTLVALVESMGRFVDGNDLLSREGLYGDWYEVKVFRTPKPKTVAADPPDPFQLRGFIGGLARGQLTDAEQLSWTFSHMRKAPILVDVRGASISGTLVLNGSPIAYYAGATGGKLMRLMLEPGKVEAFRRGKNELRFAPDPDQEHPLSDFSSHTTLYECEESLTGSGSWSFAKWEPPAASHYSPVTKTAARGLRGAPCWWRCTFEIGPGPEPVWIETAGLSKGQVFVNQQNLGRYFTARMDGKAVGPQTRLYLPESWYVTEKPNELVIFDEHGFDPTKVKLVRGIPGQFEAV